MIKANNYMAQQLKSKANLLIVCLLLGHSIAFAQAMSAREGMWNLPDSAKVFTIENFYELVLKNHPVAKQTALLTDVAKQEIRMARGQFDPKLEASYLTKNYNDKEYYSTLKTGLKLPTRLPFDPSIGFENNRGEYLNPERYIGNEFDYRQYYAGISLPLGRGLITDERRTVMEQAELFQDLTEAEQVKLINKLLLEANKEYWQWYYAYYQFRLMNRSADIALEIFNRVKVNYQYGEAAPIDTIQAKITWQQRNIEQQEALLDYQNSGLSLSNYLWDSLYNPLNLDLNWVPVLDESTWNISASELEELMAQAKANHPELLKLDIKLNQLELERRLAAEYLKPQLDLNYYFINQPFDPAWNSSLQFAENYKLGLDFSFPIFLRKERAKLAQTKLKVANVQYEQSLTEREIINELSSIYNQLVNLKSVISQQQAMMENYEQLLEAELLNLNLGESDLFKINLQQEKLIQSQTKWLKLSAEFEKQKAYLQWAAGVRNLGMM